MDCSAMTADASTQVFSVNGSVAATGQRAPQHLRLGHVDKVAFAGAGFSTLSTHQVLFVRLQTIAHVPALLNAKADRASF